MMKYPALFVIFILFAFDNAFGTSNLIVKDASHNYDVGIGIEKCESDRCEGKASVKLLYKTTQHVVQQFESDSLYLSSDSIKKMQLQIPLNTVEIHKSEIGNSIIFDDFNFDGSEDIAIADEGHAYNVYVYNISQKKFIYSEDLSALTTEYGMFIVDRKRKRLEVMTAKNGCCQHWYTEYAIAPKKGLIEVSNREEAITNGGTGDKVVVTTNNLVNGRWVKRVTTYRIKDYRKNQ